MKIIEKKCPNCGAGLSFGENDKSCKCEYCHREFEIERDEKKESIDAYNLIDPETAKTVAKTGIAVFAISSIIPIIVFIIVLIGFIFIGVNIAKDINKDPFKDDDSKVVETEKAKVISNINELNNTQLKLLDTNCYSVTNTKGESSTKYSYDDEDDEVIKHILAYKDNSNYLFVVRKTLFINFFNKSDKKTVIIPVKYENVVNTLDRLSDESENILDGYKVDAPKYYLNGSKTSYLRGGYSDYNKFYAEKITPLKNNGYKITEK